MLSLPIAFTSAIGVFAPVFSRPVWQPVQVLLTGAVLAPGQRTVTAMLRMGMFQRCWSALLSGCMRRRATPQPTE